ncbi:MAG: cysteine peptidase family C39 domain-containing protein [Armatimonadota bacterium]
MSEPIRQPGRTPESFTPKQPEIASMIAQGGVFASDTIIDPFAGGEPPRTSNRILNYRRIHPWENYFLASAICSVALATGADEDALKTIGHEQVDNGLHFFSAMTGDMFTVLYAADKPCDSGITNYFFVPQVVKQAYAAFGYECIYLSTEQIQQDFRTVMNAIKASVDNGIPVLAWGMGNVILDDGWHGNMPEGCLIGGYDENDLLYVNLYPGQERMNARGSYVDEDGYSAITHGLDGTKGLFFVGNPIEQPDLRNIYRRAIENIPAFLALPPADGYVFGQEAFEKWADTLLDESRFAGKTDDELNGICWNMHCSPYCNICTSAAEAYIRAAAEVYDIALAKKLLPLYEKYIQLRQGIWALHGDFFPPMDKFSTREFRMQIADMLRQMGRVCDDILRAFD